MPRPKTEYDTKRYKDARRQLLADNPICHWCRKAKATELDHLVEHDAGGTIDDGYVPACKPCNSRRGAQHVNRKTAHRIQTRKNVLLQDSTLTPSPIHLFIPNGQNQPEPVERGNDRPRLETISPECDGSFVDIVGDMSLTLLGVELMEWQRYAITKILSFKNSEEDGQPDLVHRTSLTSVARQNGKTHILKLLILFYLLEMPKIRGQKQTIVSTAHRLDLACLVFDELADTLENLGAHVIRSYGRNQVIMPDGSRWFVKAPKPSIGHGMSIDLAIADEIFDIAEIAVEAGLKPAQRARRSPHLAMFSTAGTESSTLFLRYREDGLRRIDRGTPSDFAMLEWSPPPDIDPLSDAAFRWGNPALEKTLRKETLIQERESPDRAAYFRSSLNLWISVSAGWIPLGKWPALEYDGEIPSGGIVAVESSFDDSRYFATRSVSLGDGRTLVTVAFVVESMTELWERINDLSKDPQIKFVFSPTVAVHCPPALERRMTICGYAEILKYTPVVKNLINDNRLVHTGETMLAEHVQRAVLVKTQGSIAVSSQKSPGPIELCRTMIWGTALVSRPTNQGKPAFVMVRN